MWEGSTEKSTIYIPAFTFRFIYILTSRTVRLHLKKYLDSSNLKVVTCADWQHVLFFTVQTRTVPKSTHHKLFPHTLQPSRSLNESSMYKSIQIFAYK